MQKVISSNIDNIGYGKGILVIEFKGKNFYKYDNITEKQFKDFVEAKSKGKFSITPIEPSRNKNPLNTSESAAMFPDSCI